MRIDKEALVKYLRRELDLCLKAEKIYADGKNYEKAANEREHRFAYGNLLLMIEGDEYHKPVSVEEGGFMINGEE